MKNLFKRKRKPDGVEIKIKVGVGGVTEGLMENLAKCGRYVRVEYYPFNVKETEAWVVTFPVALADAHGSYYGNKGIEIINAVGLPGLKNVTLVTEGGGRAVVKSPNCPTPRQITELAYIIERRATFILDEYRRFETMGQVRKGKK